MKEKNNESIVAGKQPNYSTDLELVKGYYPYTGVLGVDPTVLISAQYKLGDIVKAFDHAVQSGVLKVLIEL